MALKVDLGLQITAINNATNAIKGVGSDVKSLGENAQATANRLKAIQVVIAGILIEKTQEWGRALVETAAAAQLLDVRLQSFAGSAQKAQAVSEDLFNSFKATPFNISQMTASWIKMQATINNQGQTSSVIHAIVNDVAALGGKDENIDQLATSFQLLFAKGYASAREYRSILQQTGLTLGDLAHAAGVSGANAGQQFADKLQQGFVTAQQFTDAFVKASQARFGNYAELLKSTVAGALGNVSNTIDDTFLGLQKSTTLSTNLTAFLNNIATAIQGIGASITQPQIDKFFNWLSEIAPLAIKAGIALVNIGTAVIAVGAAAGALLSRLPQEALEYGIIGYFLFGKKGALIGAALGGVEGQAEAFGSAIDRIAANAADKMGAAGAADWFRADIEKNKHSLLEAMSGFSAGAGSTPNFNFAPTLKQLQQIKADMEALQHMKPGIALPGADMSTAAEDALKAAAAMTQTLKDDLAGANDQIKILNFQTGGDELGANLAELTKKQDQFNKNIDSAVKSAEALKVHTKENADLVTQLKTSEGQYADAIQRAKDLATELYQITVAQFNLSQQQAVLQNNALNFQTRLNTLGNDALDIQKGTSYGQAEIAVLQQRNQLQQQSLAVQQQIMAITKQQDVIANNPAATAAQWSEYDALQKTKDAAIQLNGATQTAMKNLSVDAKMRSEFLQSLSGALENDAASGISGLIEGTETLGDVMRKVFTDMIDMSIKYLLQLVEMQIFGAAAASSSLAIAGPIAAAMQALWSPAAMAASIATFGTADAIGAAAYEASMATAMVPLAKGGIPTSDELSGSILSRPTMFLGGEAGSEAVMPLARGKDGSLGVRMHGSGGGDTHIHIHGMPDASSGANFLMKNMHIISAGLQHTKNLNQQGRNHP